MEAVIGDNYDMMALTELWDRPKESWELDIKYPGRVFCSEPTDRTDPAAGAAIILSKRMAARLITWKAEGTRFVWVRLEGQFYNILFIAAYIPHKMRVNPTQSQSLSALERLCHTLQAKYPKDQLLIGMDANAKVARSQLPYVGKYMMHYQNDSGGDRLMELMQHTNLVAASTHFASPKSQSLGQATYTKNGLPGQIDYILCSRKHMSNMGRCRVMWNRSLDAHAEKTDHGLVRMYIRFRIKAHRKLSDSARTFNRAALKSDENRELLNLAYISARDEYDQLSPPLPQSNAPRKTTTVFHRQKISENRTLDVGSGTTRHTSRTPDQHPNRSQSSPQSSFPLDIGPISPPNTSVSGGQKISISKYPNDSPGTTRHTSRTPDQHPNRSQSPPTGPTPPNLEPQSPPILCAESMTAREKANALFGRIQSSLRKAGTALPRNKNPKLFRREVSQEALDIIKLRRSQVQGCRTQTEVRRVKNLFRPLLSRQARKDWRDHVTRQIDAVVEADARSDSKAWWQSIHRIAGKSKRFNATAPAADSIQELAERWAEYGESKFAATSREASRSRVTIPPANTRSQDIPSRSEIMAHLQALSKNKAPGLSGLPVESYLASPHATEDLIELIQFIFRNEVVPDDMAVGEFVMLHKGKGGTDDMAQYRAVCLEEVGLKLAASIMLARLSEEVGETRSNRTKTQFAAGSGKGKEPKNTKVTKYLPRTQAGFRKGRSTRDNSYALRSLINLAIELRTRLCVTFLDLKQAFDSVSHACLEEALRDAGASDKSIAMFRAVYSMAKGAVRVTGADGSRLISREFDIGRGVLQGDLISPLYFIIALAYVFKESDPGGSAKILGLLIDALFYADDAALLSSTAEEAAKRMDAISKALREMADMEIHLGKTKVVHAQDAYICACHRKVYMRAVYARTRRHSRFLPLGTRVDSEY